MLQLKQKLSKIKFIEKTHQYFTEEGKELISVSKFVEKFKPHIDWVKKAAGVAARERKEGKKSSTKSVLSRWKDKAQVSAGVGTLYHSIKEQELIQNSGTIFYNVPCATKHSPHVLGTKLSIPINLLSNGEVYTEIMIYDLEYMVCGQADKVIVADNRINIWDYKTDKEIPFHGFSNKWVAPAKMLDPVSHLDDCKGNLYSLKMSLYMYMLWKANKGKFLPGDLILEHVHLKRDEAGMPILENGKPVVLKTEEIRVPYRKKEVQDMLKTLKLKTKQAKTK